MKPVLFIDSVCPKAYTPRSLDEGGLGGTESTVIRVAEALARQVPVQVLQHCRTEGAQFGAEYAPIPKKLSSARAVVVLRNPALALAIKRTQRDTPVFLWLHDLIQQDMLQYTRELAALGVRVLVVSEYHSTTYVELVRQDASLTNWPRVDLVYNPIDDTLHPSGAPYDVNKLVFFSSPHKGLKQTLPLFEMARRQNPNFKLYVSNPGYYDMPYSGEGIVKLGALSHREALTHVEQALCVFYPNYVFPETFGLVFAEANAVGTPVLTHPHGAAPEILSNRSQLVDCRDHTRVIDRLMAWYGGGRPSVEGDKKFRLESVISKWYNLLKV